MKAGVDDTGGYLAVLEATSDPGFGPPRHIRHGSDEPFYVLGGEFAIGCPEERCTLRIQRYDSAFVGPPLGT